ncbi:DsbA family oxidoreductase [Clostridium amazonitimonense]|uniref:DsbA family oxidoreductase n=1 Tax=Clostridium amazonitimonense TaxID=1499689 RepID=UPI000509BB1B|nr:DsbA family protein [Clostridium amazonitimonense]
MSVKMQIFSDYVCPFCYIGSGIIRQLKEDGIEIEIEWLPFELHPETPLSGAKLNSRFPQTQIDMMFKMLKERGKEFNIRFSEVDILPNSYRALEGGQYAKLKGKYDEYSRAMFKAYFENNENIGKKEIINEIASNIGLNINEMNKEIDSGKFKDAIDKTKSLANKYAINSVPTFIINDTYKIVGAKDYEYIKEFLLNIKKEV